MSSKLKLNLEEVIIYSVIEIKNLYPRNITSHEKKVADAVVRYISGHIFKFIDDYQDFDWKNFGHFCEVLTVKLDSRIKAKPSLKSILGIYHKGVYEKNNIKWIANLIQRQVKKAKRQLISAELMNLLNGFEKKKKKMYKSSIKNTNPAFYKILVKELCSLNKGMRADWRSIFSITEKYAHSSINESFVFPQKAKQ